MSVSLDFLEGLKADLYTWYWEALDKGYKKVKSIYPDVIEKLEAKDFPGGFWKGTSAIGATKLQPLVPGGKISEDNPTEGFTVYGSLKTHALSVEVPYHMVRDGKQSHIENFLKDVAQKTWPDAVEETKDDLLFTLLNRGGFTAGDDIFNNDNSKINLTTYTSPKLCYDGLPFFNRSNNLRTAKNNATYYNAIALADTNATNADTMWVLLAGTNAKKENGQPFDNRDDVIVICDVSVESAWKKINESTLNPDGANNDKNTMQGMFKKVIGTTRISTTGMSIMGRANAGIAGYFGDPKFNFWEVPNPPSLWASVMFDWSLFVKNFRFHVANNAPLS